MVNVITRAEWGSTESDPAGSWIGAVDEIIIHHFYRPDVPASASAEHERGAMRGVQDFHTDKGWDDIGYSFVVFDSGRAYEARGWHRSGAHTVGKNHSALAFCLAIDGDQADATDEAYRAIGELIEEGIRRGAIKPNPRITGHTDYAAKSCPGDRVYRDMAAKIGGAGKRDYNYGDRVLKEGIRGSDVKVWQNNLLEYDSSFLPDYGADGDFGEETVEFTREFQLEIGLKVDGVVGSDTRAAMENALADARDGKGAGESHEAEVEVSADEHYDTFLEAYERVEAIFVNREVTIETEDESRHERLSRIAVHCLLKKRVPGGSLTDQYNDVRASVDRLAD